MISTRVRLFFCVLLSVAILLMGCSNKTTELEAELAKQQKKINELQDAIKEQNNKRSSEITLDHEEVAVDYEEPDIESTNGQQWQSNTSQNLSMENKQEMIILNNELRFSKFSISPFTYYREHDTARMKFAIKNISDSVIYLYKDDFVIKKDNENTIKPVKDSGGFDKEGVSSQPMFILNTRELYPGDEVQVSFDYRTREKFEINSGYILFWTKYGKLLTIENLENLYASQQEQNMTNTITSVVTNIEYIIADSDKRKLVDADLMGMNNTLLRLARNEIYARHGYVFKSEDLQEYFSRKSWYKQDPSYDGVLNELEKYNTELIQSKED